MWPVGTGHPSNNGPRVKRRSGFCTLSSVLRTLCDLLHEPRDDCRVLEQGGTGMQVASKKKKKHAARDDVVTS